MKAQTKLIIFTKSGKVSKFFLNAINHCRFNEKTCQIYTGYYNGSGRWTQAASVKSDIKAILKAQGYKYEEGNDAPKGGALGEFLKVSKTAFNFIQSIKSL